MRIGTPDWSPRRLPPHVLNEAVVPSGMGVAPGRTDFEPATALAALAGTPHTGREPAAALAGAGRESANAGSLGQSQRA